MVLGIGRDGAFNNFQPLGFGKSVGSVLCLFSKSIFNAVKLSLHSNNKSGKIKYIYLLKRQVTGYIIMFSAYRNLYHKLPHGASLEFFLKTTLLISFRLMDACFHCQCNPKGTSLFSAVLNSSVEWFVLCSIFNSFYSLLR